ncbi:MAG: transcriptional repressor NrdR [Deltaproteobacteria bacterium]|nr:transcriptional repressor NrdR [Deltaproteobacteria bacterium]
MKCPFCAYIDTKVIDSRLSKEGAEIRRRRECDECQKRFTTYERVEEVLPMVVKKDGRREAFDRAKIIGGLMRACEKRPVPVQTVEKIVDQIQADFIERGEKEIPSTLIGERIMDGLKSLDNVAYVRFASVYRSFKDMDEFVDLIKTREKEEKSEK